MDERYAETSREVSTQNDSCGEERALRLNCDKEGRQLKKALMYNLCEGFLRLCDVTHVQNCSKTIKIFKKSGYGLHDFLETSSTVKELRRWVREVEESQLPSRGFLKKTLDRHNRTVCTLDTHNDAKMLQKHVLDCHSDTILPHTD